MTKAIQIDPHGRRDVFAGEVADAVDGWCKLDGVLAAFAAVAEPLLVEVEVGAYDREVDVLDETEAPELAEVAWRSPDAPAHVSLQPRLAIEARPQGLDVAVLQTELRRLADQPSPDPDRLEVRWSKVFIGATRVALGAEAAMLEHQGARPLVVEAGGRVSGPLDEAQLRTLPPVSLEVRQDAGQLEVTVTYFWSLGWDSGARAGLQNALVGLGLTLSED